MDLGSVGTGLALLGASQVTKDAIERMLAPTADYIGAGILSSVKGGVNLARVLVRGAEKRRSPLDEEARIPPRILRGVLDDAPFCEDEITAEYLGGVLAASWSHRARDDRGVAHLATIRRLSVYALRVHYILYATYAEMCFAGKLTEGDANAGVHVPYANFERAMEFTEDETGSIGEIWSHAIVALERENLAEITVAGAARYYREDFDENANVPAETLSVMREHGGMVFGPTVHGKELFLAGCGFSGYLLHDLPVDAWSSGSLRIDNVAVELDGCAVVRPSYSTPGKR